MSNLFARRKNWLTGDMTPQAVNADLQNLRDTLNRLDLGYIQWNTINASGQLLGKGTSTNDNASAGYVGEYIESVVSGNTGASGQYYDLTSISLTPGDWDVTAIIEYSRNGATYTSVDLACFIGLVSGNSSSGFVRGSNYANFNSGGALLTFTEIPISVPDYRLSLASTTTVYLKGYPGIYTVGQSLSSGRISARRAR